MGGKKPFFSIITVCYNAGEALLRAVEELRAQDCGDYEHIIKDGGSADGSLDAVRATADGDGRIHVISSPDGGIYDAMNEALAVARGRYVYFLNCGDRFVDSEVLGDVKRFIEHWGIGENSCAERDEAVVYGDFILRGELLRQPERLSGYYLYRRPLNHQSMFFGRGVFDKLGNFDTELAIRADHELTLRAFKADVCFKKLDRVISIYEGGGFSESGDKKELRKAELEAIRQRYFSAEERKKHDRRMRMSLIGVRRRIRSSRSPRWLRALYRKAVNFFSR